MQKEYTIHIDVDSPVVLANFYNVEIENYPISKLEKYYEKTFERMLELLDSFNIKATFFCVASEIESSEKIQEIIKKAVNKGHYIGNHTYSHPFGLNELNSEQIEKEISEANRVYIEKLNHKPMGFRAPGYAIDTNVINRLETNGIQYDSSGAWIIFHIIFKLMRRLKNNRDSGQMKVGFGETNSNLRPNMYVPSIDNWKKKSKVNRQIKEYPLSTSFYFIPCYSNLHLYFSEWMMPIILKFTQRHQLLIYLMHSIEFASFEDDFIPKEIYVHPHTKDRLERKKVKLTNILRILSGNRVQKSIELNQKEK